MVLRAPHRRPHALLDDRGARGGGHGDRGAGTRGDAGMTAAAVHHPLRGLPLEQQTLPALLERQADVYGDRPLFRCGQVELSYGGVRDLAARSAARLRDCGVARGDRVAAMCENRTELFELILGCVWLGAIVVPINTASRGPQLEHVLGNCGARLMLADATVTDALAAIETHGALEGIWV